MIGVEELRLANRRGGPGEKDGMCCEERLSRVGFSLSCE